MGLNDQYTIPEDQVTSFRGQSNHTLWSGCPHQQVRQNFSRGYFVEDDFRTLVTGKYTATQSGSKGTFALDDAENGVALADCDSTTVTQGVNVQLNSSVGGFVATQAAGTLYFETRLKAADIATGPEFFVGLHGIDTGIIGTSAIDGTKDFIGFKSTTDDGILLPTNAGGSETAGAAAHTLVEDTYVKLGFKVVNRETIQFFVNGTAVSAKSSTNIPTGLMVPSIVCQSDGATDSIAHWDWYDCTVIQEN